MGNYFLSSLNQKKSDDSQPKKSTDNSTDKTIQIDSTKENEKSIPYSYTPDQIDEKDLDNKKGTLKCIRIIRGHQKWCNCLIVLKSGNLC